MLEGPRHSRTYNNQSICICSGSDSRALGSGQVKVPDQVIQWVNSAASF